MTWIPKERYPKDWRPWFAWFPVQTGQSVTWLEVVERRAVIGYEIDWEYRRV